MINKKRFVLIELLIVVAVLGVLIALLMPVLGKAKERAREVYCMNNMRQIAVGYRNYLHENDNKWPVVVWWLDNLTPSYLYTKSLDVYICPSTGTQPLQSMDNLNGESDYLVSGSTSDIEENYRFCAQTGLFEGDGRICEQMGENNGHGNNPYHFDPSNPSPPTQTLLDAKKESRIIYEKTYANHFKRKFNVIYIDDVHYEPETQSCKEYWSLDDRYWIEWSLDDWP